MTSLQSNKRGTTYSISLQKIYLNKTLNNFYPSYNKTCLLIATSGTNFLSVMGMQLRGFVLLIFFCSSIAAKAQKIDSIYVNLYTDSLKKGTYNYINIDGLLSNGRYIPLDSNYIIFWASEGKFFGNSLWIDKNFKSEHVLIKVVCKQNPQLNKEFFMYVKKKPDDEKLKTEEELLRDMQNRIKKSKS